MMLSYITPRVVRLLDAPKAPVVLRKKRSIHAGQQFGEWTVLCCDVPDRHRKTSWRCVCSCGTQRTVISQSLLKGRSVSCGCRKRRSKHGESRPTREYGAWVEARRNSRDNAIPLCSRWEEFSAFLTDMGRCPAGLVLRNGGRYDKENCFWGRRGA